MLKEFAQYLANQQITPTERVVSINDGSYVIDGEGRPHYIEPELMNAQEPLRLNTLSAIVDYIKSEYDRDKKLMIQIFSPTRVEIYGELQIDGSRELLVRSDAIIPEFDFNYFFETEQLIIKLQSIFKRTKDRDILLQVLGNLKEENVKNTGDDGVSQQVTAKVGIANVESVKVPNPVLLAPYRTFSELEQPISPFIFRMQRGPEGALFEADGGAWRLDAIKRIKSYLEENLSEQINQDKVLILA